MVWADYIENVTEFLNSYQPATAFQLGNYDDLTDLVYNKFLVPNYSGIASKLKFNGAKKAVLNIAKTKPANITEFMEKLPYEIEEQLNKISAIKWGIGAVGILGLGWLLKKYGK